MPKISVINLGIGNIASVRFAFAGLGADVHLVEKSSQLGDSDAIVSPGVGNFRHAMQQIEAAGFPEVLADKIEANTPFLGICLGMQLLAEYGEEGGVCKGLGFVPGRVVKVPEDPQHTMPHMGWDDINIILEEPLFVGMPPKPSFYFVHSYYFMAGKENVSATCEYGTEFPVAVQKDRIFGVQFHPEKSQKNGLRFLGNFYDYLRR